MTRFFLSMSSLAPLIGIVAIRMTEVAASWAVALGIVAVLSATSLPVVMIARRQAGERPLTVASIRDDSGQIPAYLLTYIFPFAFATVDGPAAAWAYVVFALLLLVLLMRTDLGLVNPVLLAAGFHSFAVETAAGTSLTLIARRGPLVGSRIVAHPIAGETLGLGRIVEGDTNG